MHFLIRYIAFILGAIMLIPLSVLSAKDGSNRFAIFYGSLLILLFVICFFNPYLTKRNREKSADITPSRMTAPRFSNRGSDPIRIPDDPDMAMPEQPRADNTVIDFTRLRSDQADNPKSTALGELHTEPEQEHPLNPSSTEDSSVKRPSHDNAAETFNFFSDSETGSDHNHTAGSDRSDDGTLKSEEKQDQIRSVQSAAPHSANFRAVPESESVDSLLLGVIDRKIQISREEKDGFLIQTTVIIEKKPLEMSKTSRVLRELGLSATINDDDPDTGFTGHDFTVGEEHGIRYQESDSGKHFHPVIYTFRILKYILAITVLCALIIFAVWLINDMHARDRTITTFDQIVESIEPIKQQVEACIHAEGPRYMNICNDKHRSENYSWDLTDRFINNHKDPNISAIRIDGGTITVYTNYDHELRGTTYITVPARMDSKTVRWSMSAQSTCLKLKICADTTGKNSKTE
jgi:hypothetical protein